MKLSFIVVGGSLGGLAAAFSLSRSGHSVHVIEKNEGLIKVRDRTVFKNSPIFTSTPAYPRMPQEYAFLLIWRAFLRAGTLAGGLLSSL